MSIDVYNLSENPLRAKYLDRLNEFPSLRLGLYTRFGDGPFYLAVFLSVVILFSFLLFFGEVTHDHVREHYGVSPAVFGLSLLIVPFVITLTPVFLASYIEFQAWKKVLSELTDSEITEIATYLKTYLHASSDDVSDISTYPEHVKYSATDRPESFIRQLISSHESKQIAGLRYALGKGSDTFEGDIRTCYHARQNILEQQRIDDFLEK